MLLEQDRAVNGEPVAEHNQQGVQPALEVVNADDSEHDVDDGSDDGDEGSRDGLKPRVEGLRGKSKGVHVRDVVRDDSKRKDDEAELTEATGWFESCTKESTNRVSGIAFCEPRR